MANARSRARIEARIRERAAYCVEFELNDPRAAFVTVTHVEVSSDLSVSKIFYSVLGNEADKSKVAHMLEDATGFVRRQIGRVLKTRRIPRITWIFDDTIELQAKMEQSIAEALERDRQINPRAHLEDPAPDGDDPSGRAGQDEGEA
ncbi:MAG TPA: 30S ribosome-binding factor RbfA [Planctomycetes bacterium]|nr:30S ribosome-binding factor RbfA [Planctomycetota bacterium]